MNIPTALTRKFGRQLLVAKKYSPTLFFAAGVAGVVGGTFLACRSTLKLNETLDIINADVSIAKERLVESSDEVKQQQKDITIAYLRGAYTVGKLYAPAVVLTTAGLGAITGSHVILTRRNAAVTAAYAAVTRSYDEYRGRIREEIGEDKELTLYHAIEWEDVEGSDGMVQEPKNAPGSWGNPYSRFFDYQNANWKNNREHNLFFIECQERFYNHVLNSRGHVFLNEVYDNLGFPHSREGQVVGWVLDYDGEGDGDNYIDFGVHEAVNANGEDGTTSTIVLDFNVDGVVLDKIPKS